MDFNSAIILVFVAGVLLVFLWDRLKSSVKRPKFLVGTIPGQGTFSVAVVGESHYQTALESICGGRTEEGHDVVVEAQLVLEDSNPYDSNAVRVDIGSKTVGYLSRENARQYRDRLIEEGYPRIVAKCRANIRGGWDRGGGDKGHFGVWIDLPTKSERSQRTGRRTKNF